MRDGTRATRVCGVVAKGGPKVEGKGRHEVFPGSRRKALVLVTKVFWLSAR